MTVFTVHQPLPRKTEDVAPPERFAFVRDGFYFWAFLLGPLWMFWNRLWLALLIYLASTAAIQAALWAIGVSAAVKFAVGTPDRHSGRMRGRIAAALEPAPPLDQRRPGGSAQIRRRRSAAFSSRGRPMQHRRRRPLRRRFSPRGCREPSPDVIGLFPEPQARP